MISNELRKNFVLVILLVTVTNVSSQKFYRPKAPSTPLSPDLGTELVTPLDEGGEYIGPEDNEIDPLDEQGGYVGPQENQNGFFEDDEIEPLDEEGRYQGPNEDQITPLDEEGRYQGPNDDQITPLDEEGEYIGPKDDQNGFEANSRSKSKDEEDSSTSGQDEDNDTTMMTDMPAPEFKSKRFFKLNDKMSVFNELLDKDLEPKGFPFPEIHGPAPWERVCIVGAGPAGVHMSLKLKKMGYKNVTIFEKTARVGGKSYDVNLGTGTYLPQGTFSFSSESFKTLVTLAEEYGVGEYEKVPEFGVR